MINKKNKKNKPERLPDNRGKDIFLILLGIFTILLSYLSIKVIANIDIFLLSEKYPYLSYLHYIGFAFLIFVFFTTKKKNLKILSLGAIIFFIVFNYPFLAAYSHIYERDSIFSYQNALLIQEKGYSNDASTGHAVSYKKFPAFPMIQVILSDLTGISLDKSILFLPFFIIFLILPFILYKLLRIFLSPEKSLLGLLFYFISPQLNHIHYQSLAMLFLFLALYYYIKSLKDIRFFMLFLIFTALTFLTHHLVSYFLIIIIISHCVINIFQRKTRMRPIIASLFVIILALSFMSDIMITNFQEFTNTVVEPFLSNKDTDINSNNIGANKETSSDSGIFSYMGFLKKTFVGLNFNIIQIIFSSLFFFFIGLFLLIGISTYLGRSPDIAKFSLALSILFFSFFIVLIFSRGLLLFIRFIPFILFGSSYFLVNGFTFFKEKYKISRFFIILIVVSICIGGGLLSFGAQERRLFVDKDNIISDSYLLFNQEVFDTGLWANRNILPNTNIVASSLIYDSIGGIGARNVMKYNEKLHKAIFKKNYLDKDDYEYLQYKQVDYVFFESYLLQFKNNIRNQPLDRKVLQRLNTDPYFNKVYSSTSIDGFKTNK